MEKEKIAGLVRQAQNGDDRAMEQLLQLAHTSVSYQCRKIMAHPQDAEDMTQETLLKIYGSIQTLQEPEKFLSWANTIAARLCINERKRNPKDLQFAEDEEGNSVLDQIEDLDQQTVPDAVLDNEETSRMVTELIDGLPDAQRTCTYLYYYDQLSVKEIAAMIGVSENTIKSRLNYARKAIKDGVLDYEKKGVKLYSLSPLPFLLYFLRGAAEQGADPAAAGRMAEAALAAGSAAAGTAGTAGAAGKTAAAAASKTAAVKGGAVTAGKAAARGAATVTKAAATKLVAGVLAGTLVVGGAVTVLRQASPAPETSASQSEDRSSSEGDASSEREDRVEPAVPKAVPQRTTVDTGSPYAEVYLETPHFEVEDGPYRGINAYFDQMHERFNANDDGQVAWLLESLAAEDSAYKATAEDPYFYTTSYQVLGQDQRAVSVELTVQWYAGGQMTGHSTYHTFDTQNGKLLSLTDLTGHTKEEIEALALAWARTSEYSDAASFRPPEYQKDFFYYADGQAWMTWDIGGPRSYIVPIPIPIKDADPNDGAGSGSQA